MNQIALPLDWPAHEAEDAFIVSSSNAAAVKHLESFGRWPVAATLLVGPRKSGRSLLGRIFALRTEGALLDDAEGIDEAKIFHAWNEAQEHRRPLMIVADRAPPEWVIALPDLASRLAATPVIAIGDPDEALVSQLIARLLERRGLAVGKEVVSYLTPRTPRCHASVVALIDALDAAALSRRRTITVPLARDVVDGLAPVDRKGLAG